jgi:putative membrane protein
VSFLIGMVVTAVAVWASTLVDGIDLGGDTVWASIGTLVLVALIFGLVNAFVKPVFQLLTGCLYILTLGLFALVANALMFLLVGWLSDTLGLPFEVDGFWPAFWGAIIVAVVTFVLNLVLRNRSRDEAPRRREESY